MSRLKLARRFNTDTSGATAIEYAMIASVMALALFFCLPIFSGSVGALYTAVAAAF